MADFRQEGLTDTCQFRLDLLGLLPRMIASHEERRRGDFTPADGLRWAPSPDLSSGLKAGAGSVAGGVLGRILVSGYVGGPADGPGGWGSTALGSPSLFAGTGSCWSGCLRKRADPMPGGGDRLGPGPGCGDFQPSPPGAVREAHQGTPMTYAGSVRWRALAGWRVTTMGASSALSSGDRRRRLGASIAWLAGGCSAGLAAAATLQFVMGGQIDFSVYLSGASHLFDGRVYQVGLSQPPHLGFTYPPFAAVSFYPLTVIPVKAAQLIWGLVNIVALYTVVHLSIRAAFRTAPGTVVILASLILLTPVYWLDPVHRTLLYGQVNLVLAALVLADFTRSPSFRGRRLPRGVLVGIAAAIKLTPLVFILYLLVSRRMRAAGVALAAFAACCAVAAALSPSAWWSYWSRDVFNTSRVGAPLYYITNQSLRAAADRATHAIASPILVTLLSAVVLIAGLTLAAWAFRASSDLLGVLVTAATGLLVSPVTWDHHMVWIAPAIIWLAGASDRPARGWAWALAAAALFWMAPIWFVPHVHGVELHENIWQFLCGNSFFLAVIAFLTGTAAMLVTRHQSARRRTIPILGDTRGSPESVDTSI